MKLSSKVAFAVTFTAAFTVSSASRATGPKATVVRGHQRINELLRLEKRAPARAKVLDAKIRKIVEHLMDFPTLAKRSLGRRFRELDEAKKREYISLFTQLVESSYLRKLKGRLDYDIQYGKPESQGSIATVPLVVIRHRKGRKSTTEITYRLHKQGGSWKIVDVVTNQVSLTRNYRRSFGRIWRREGYEGLIRKMKRKIGKLNR